MSREHLVDPAAPAAQPPAMRQTDQSADGVAVVALETPLQRGGRQLVEITLRKPTVGTLRGCKLAELVQMDADALTRLLPRITDLTEAEVKRLDPADLLQFGTEVADFLLPKRFKEG